MGLNICLLWTIFCYLKMLTIFEKIETLKSTLKTFIENIESNSMLKFWKTLTSHWVSMFIFFTSKTLKRNHYRYPNGANQKKYFKKLLLFYLQRRRIETENPNRPECFRRRKQWQQVRFTKARFLITYWQCLFYLAGLT